VCVEGTDALERIVVDLSATGKQRTFDSRYLFIFIGAQPHTEWLQGTLALDDHGFVLTGADLQNLSPEFSHLGRSRLPMETSVPGMFAAGDVRHGSVNRVTAAAGEGSTAVPRFTSTCASFGMDRPVHVRVRHSESSRTSPIVCGVTNADNGTNLAIFRPVALAVISVDLRLLTARHTDLICE
jgi:thioredoxin reductase (NADPH)